MIFLAVVAEDGIDEHRHAARSRRVGNLREPLGLRQPGDIADAQEVICHAQVFPSSERIEQITGRIEDLCLSEVQRIGDERRRQAEHLVPARLERRRHHPHGDAALSGDVAQQQDGRCHAHPPFFRNPVYCSTKRASRQAPDGLMNATLYCFASKPA